MYRLFTAGVVLLWLAAMSALFMRDVWPAWTAQDPPMVTAEQFAALGPREEQCRIQDAQGQLIGTAWTTIRTGGNTSVQNTLLLNGIPMLPELRIETTTEFDPAGGLDSFRLDVYGVPMTSIQVRGERRGAFFPCELRAGPRRWQANLDLSASRLISDTLRPFSLLPNLKVGQSWRMQVLDPVSAALLRRAQFTSMVARVTRCETIHSPVLEKDLECFVVETSPQKATAWVAPDGRVLKQEVDLPGVGTICVIEEPLDTMARDTAKQRVRAQPLGVPE